MEIALLFGLLALLQPAVCSLGDRDGNLPFHLRMLYWSCPENCQYTCMHEVTKEHIQTGKPVRQFYGKWPFLRLWGIQEPASALFSFLNALSNLWGYWRFVKLVAPSYPHHMILRIQLMVALVTWFWSTVFHARDTYWTEKLDYFSAAALIVSGLITQFVRMTGPKAVIWHWLYALLWISLYTAHVSYLLAVKFDYGYNMAANVGAGVLYALLWVMWCLKHWRERVYVWRCIIVVSTTSGLLLLELLDFPPLWWVLDAHSLWHLGTIPLPYIWYSFLVEDAKFETQRMKKAV